MHSSSIALALATVLAAPLLLVVPAAAQQEDAAEPTRQERNRARRLFSRGMREAGRQDYQTAADHFREARSLVRAPAIDYNLAAVLFELGELVDAAEVLAVIPDYPDATPEMRSAAETLLAQVRAGGGTFDVVLSGDGTGVEVLVDDDPVPPDGLGSVWLVPGTYVLRAVRDGQEVGREDLTVAAGDARSVQLVVVPTPRETARAMPAQPRQPPEETDSGSVLGKWWFWTITGAVLIGAGILIAVLLASSGEFGPRAGRLRAWTGDAVKTTVHYALAAVLLFALACSGERTEVILAVYSDLTVPDRLDQIVVDITSPTSRTTQSMALLGPGETPLPRTLGMLWEEGPLGPYEVVVSGRRGGTSVVDRTARFTFEQGRTLLLRVDLEASCLSVDCGDDETCSDGACRSVNIAPGELVEWSGSVTPADGAILDSTVPDSAVPDAAVPDSTMPDRTMPDTSVPDACMASVETCNGADDDCDGMLDEDFDLATDPANCGACGVSCGVMELCADIGVGVGCTPERAAIAPDGGLLHTCVMHVSGAVSCWGRGESGELGDAMRASSRTPVAVSGISDAIALAVGGQSSCAIRRGGQGSCWGANDSGQLGDGSTTLRDAPVDVAGLSDAIAMDVGRRHACAVRGAGTVSCWGDNGSGRLGDGTTDGSDTPTNVMGVADASDVATGWDHSCAVRAGGLVSCWGENGDGQLGDGTTDDSDTPTDVLGLTGATRVTAGREFSCVVTAGGEVLCWGRNDRGQLGDGTTSSRPGPAAAGSFTDAIRVRAGEVHACALRRGGTISCWGDGGNGRLGNDDTTRQTVPVDVVGGTTFSALGLGATHSCAAHVDGELSCWGGNGNAQLGDGTTTSQSSPVAVAGIP